jgi:riboflavin transporter FmnP
MVFKKGKTLWISGTALMAALAVVLDYSLKFSGLKIQFPWMPMLKFDFTEIPIILAFLLYGFLSAVIASLIVFIGMLMRSSDLIGATMKVVSELSTISGIMFSLWVINRIKMNQNYQALISGFFAIFSRLIATSISNVYVLPTFYQIPYNAALGMLPLIAVFNILQGFMNLFVGYLLFISSKKRLLGV